MMAQAVIPPSAKPLFSKPVVPRFWEQRRLWDPLSVHFRPDFSAAGMPHTRQETLAEMWAAAQVYENKHGVEFASLTQFSRPLLNELHSPVELPDSFYGDVCVVSESDPSVLEYVNLLTMVANSSKLTRSDQQAYFAALAAIYGKFERTPADVCHGRGTTLCVGIRREGYILCERMHWFVSDHQLAPDMKRIPFHDGLLVGSTALPSIPPCQRIVIVDGAIASGATIITLIERLREPGHCPEFHIFSVHSGYEGLRAITRFCDSIGIRVSITVGHATHGINKKFYAVDPKDKSRVMVGDLGDTISDLTQQ